MRTPATIQAVRNAVIGDHAKQLGEPKNTCRRNDLGLDKSSFNRIIKQDLNLHCYCYVFILKEKVIPKSSNNHESRI